MDGRVGEWTQVLVKIGLGAGILLLAASIFVTMSMGTNKPLEAYQSLVSKRSGLVTVQERLVQFEQGASGRLNPYFEEAGVAYPPARVLMVGLKQEKRLELYAGDADDNLAFIRAYPILAASGKLGPKLRQGDRQVPEGICTYSPACRPGTTRCMRTCVFSLSVCRKGEQTP